MHPEVLKYLCKSASNLSSSPVLLDCFWNHKHFTWHFSANSALLGSYGIKRKENILQPSTDSESAISSDVIAGMLEDARYI